MGERLVRNEEVGGSIPLISTSSPIHLPARRWRQAQVDSPGSGSMDAEPLRFRGEAAGWRLGCRCFQKVRDLDRARWGTSGALYLQSATAGRNSFPRASVSDFRSGRGGVEGRARRNSSLRTPSGPEGSSGKWSLECVADHLAGAGRPEWVGGEVRRRVHDPLFSCPHSARPAGPGLTGAGRAIPREGA